MGTLTGFRHWNLRRNMLNHKNLLAALLVAMGIFGFLAFALPEYHNIVAAKELLKAREDRLTERQELVKKVEALNEEYKNNISSVNKIDSILPTKKQQDEMVSSLYTISSQTGVILVELVVADGTAQGEIGYKSSLITLRAFGRYEQFFNFLQLLEQSLRLYEVQNISVSEATAGGGASTGTLNFEIKLIANSIK